MPDRLAQLIREHQPCIVLTGAGVATESGVPDFRSPTGIWAEIDPMEYATLSAFRRDPAKVWWFYRQRIEMLTRAEPNSAHRALRELERRGLVEAIVTQNIDMLHTRAGSENVIEVHGSIRTSSCQSCARPHDLARVQELLEEKDAVPLCDACGAVLKPDVVFFEEQLPAREIDRAFRLAEQAASMLVIGSTLEVHPVAGLPGIVAGHGGQLAIVNLGPISYEGQAKVTIDAKAGDTLTRLVELLDETGPFGDSA